MRRGDFTTTASGVTIIALLCVITLALPASNTADAGDSSDVGTLTGKVFNTHYESGVPHAYVMVESAEGYREACITDEEGECSLDLPYGMYSIRVLIGDQEVDNGTSIIIGPSPKVYEVLVSFPVDEPVHLSGVIKVGGKKASQEKIVFEGVGNSYRNETVTGTDGTYALDVPFGSLLVTSHEGDKVIAKKEIGPTIVPGPLELDIDLRTTGAPSFSEWSTFVETTWTGLAIWIAVSVGLVLLYVAVRRRVYKWLEDGNHRLAKGTAEMMAYALRGYFKVGLLYLSLIVLDTVVDVTDEAGASWMRFWLYSLVLMLVLWVSARLLLMAVDYLMGRLRAQRRAEKSEIPETAFIFVHGVLRYIVIGVFGFLILLILLSGTGLYEDISSGFNSFVGGNVAYLVLLVLIVVLFLVTQRFVKLTLAQMRETSTRFSPQMIGIMGLVAKVMIAFIFSVLFIFTLLTMAGMQEVGALILALLTTMVGMIVAMTTTGAVGNALSGMVLLSLRPIEKDQWVEVAGDTFGKVVEVTTFFTRIRTLNNTIVEMPNNLVLNKGIKNFSREKSVGIEVDLGIGYDVPADVVSDLLKKGAKGTKDIVRDPKPQVMVTEFGDYSVKYRLRAFTCEMARYYQTKSSLMENIQELFYTEGIEIMTPWQLVRREEGVPCRDDVIARYTEYMKKRDEHEGKGETIAAGMDMLEDQKESKNACH